jgi:hypothetical protein
MREAHVPNKTPLTAKITKTANLAFLILVINLKKVNEVNNYIKFLG